MIHPYIKGLLFHLFALLIWVTSSRGQTLRADLQLDSGKLIGFFFGGSADIKESASLSFTLDVFLRSSKELQLVYVGPAAGVSEFDRFKQRKLLVIPTDATTRSRVSKSLTAYESSTRLGRAIIGKFKVSKLPTLLICNANLEVLESDGLSFGKNGSEPYAYWKSLESARKPTKKRKPGVDAAIDELELRRLQIISSVNGFIDSFSATLRSGTVDDAKALGSLRVNISTWLEYSRTLNQYAKKQLEQVEDEILRISASENFSIDIKRQLLDALEKKKVVLLNYSENLFPLLLKKRREVHKVLDECNELLLTIEVLGREKAVTIILKKLADLQEIHFREFK